MLCHIIGAKVDRFKGFTIALVFVPYFFILLEFLTRILFIEQTTLGLIVKITHSIMFTCKIIRLLLLSCWRNSEFISAARDPGVHD